MIESLQRFDKRVAAGIVARAAIALEDDGNPASRPAVDGENAIRAALLAEVRMQLGYAPDDNSREVVERLAEKLDEVSESLIGPSDTDAALVRLAERGDLPSDLYEIKVIQNIIDFFGNTYPLERELIEATVRWPAREQHYGRAAPNAKAPSLVSLFYRPFTTRFPQKNFGMLVAAQREGLLLNVHQAWRLYPSVVKSPDGVQPVDLLRRFADAYGSDVEVEGKSGHFFLFAERPAERFRIKLVPRRGQRENIISVSQFMQFDHETRRARASLIVAIDLDRYRTTLTNMRVPRADIRELNQPRPTHQRRD